MNQTTETMAGPNLSSKWSRDLETSLPAVSCLSTVYVTSNSQVSHSVWPRHGHRQCQVVDQKTEEASQLQIKRSLMDQTWATNQCVWKLL